MATAAAAGVPSLLCTVPPTACTRPSSRGILLQRVAASRWENRCCAGIRALGSSSKAKGRVQAAVQVAPSTQVPPETEDSRDSPEAEDDLSVRPRSNLKYLGEDYLVKKVSSQEVQEIVKSKRSIPVIVDFYATWCGPCVLMAQELEMLAVEYENDALFIKVNTDDEYEFARDMQVRGLPTLYVFSPDPRKDAIRIEGLVPPEMIKNIINSVM